MPSVSGISRDGSRIRCEEQNIRHDMSDNVGLEIKDDINAFFGKAQSHIFTKSEASASD